MEDQDFFDTDKYAKVLVVDDQLPFLRLFSKFFDSKIYDVRSASSGQQALDILNHEDGFDLIVLDVMMPNMNGFEVCKAVREKFTLFQLPILFLTAAKDTDSVVKGFSLGANDFVAKPFEAAELIARSQTLIKLKKLYETNAQLHSELDAKNKFLQMNIHDLKNPLTSISMLAELVKNDLQDEDNPRNLEMIIKSSDFMLTLVDQILEISAIETKNYKLKKDLIDLNLLVAQVIDFNKPIADRKNQKIHFEMGPIKKCMVESDHDKMIQAINNIVSNAIKYSPKEKNIWARIDLKEYENTQYVRFELQDEGPGFTDDDRLNMFSKFKKLSAKPTGGESSSGLGLAIAKELIELHGGKIWLDNEVKVGSKFVIELPLKNGH